MRLNVNRYKLVRRDAAEKSDDIHLKFDGKNVVKAYFYHFTHVSYFDSDTVNINVFSRYFPLDKNTIYCFYLPYLKELKAISELLKVPLTNKPGLKQKEKTTLKIWIVRAVFKMRELLNHNADFIAINQL